MADYGLTDQGFVIKRLQQILTEQRAKAVELFQDLVVSGDTVDTSDSSLLGRLITLDSGGDAELWELAQLVYSSGDPNSAVGIPLDNLVQYTGIERYPASPTTATALFTGDLNTVISLGSTVTASNTNKQFTTSNVLLSTGSANGIVISVLTVADSSVYSFTYTPLNGSTSTVSFTSGVSATTTTILAGLLAACSAHPLLSVSVASGTLVVSMADSYSSSAFTINSRLAINKLKVLGELTCIENGANEQVANTITSISTPILGWDSVTNIADASVGRLIETDSELRIRFRNTKFERSANLVDSLYSALLSVDGVLEVSIYENDTSTTDSNGVYGHSFLPVVLGGSSQEIAKAIWNNKPTGILSQGDTSIDITDSQGFPHTISFKRPTPVPIYISATLDTSTETKTVFPGDGVDQVKANIVEWFSENQKVGLDVIYSRLFTPINLVSGFSVSSLVIGTSPSPSGTANLTIPFTSIASISTDNIVLTVV